MIIVTSPLLMFRLGSSQNGNPRAHTDIATNSFPCSPTYKLNRNGATEIWKYITCTGGDLRMKTYLQTSRIAVKDLRLIFNSTISTDEFNVKADKISINTSHAVDIKIACDTTKHLSIYGATRLLLGLKENCTKLMESLSLSSVKQASIFGGRDSVYPLVNTVNMFRVKLDLNTPNINAEYMNIIESTIQQGYMCIQVSQRLNIEKSAIQINLNKTLNLITNELYVTKTNITIIGGILLLTSKHTIIQQCNIIGFNDKLLKHSNVNVRPINLIANNFIQSNLNILLLDDEVWKFENNVFYCTCKAISSLGSKLLGSPGDINYCHISSCNVTINQFIELFIKGRLCKDQIENDTNSTTVCEIVKLHKIEKFAGEEKRTRMEENSESLSMVPTVGFVGGISAGLVLLVVIALAIAIIYIMNKRKRSRDLDIIIKHNPDQNTINHDSETIHEEVMVTTRPTISQNENTQTTPKSDRNYTTGGCLETISGNGNALDTSDPGGTMVIHDIKMESQEQHSLNTIYANRHGENAMQEVKDFDDDDVIYSRVYDEQKDNIENSTGPKEKRKRVLTNSSSSTLHPANEIGVIHGGIYACVDLDKNKSSKMRQLKMSLKYGPFLSVTETTELGVHEDVYSSVYGEYKVQMETSKVIEENSTTIIKHATRSTLKPANEIGVINGDIYASVDLNAKMLNKKKTVKN